MKGLNLGETLGMGIKFHSNGGDGGTRSKATEGKVMEKTVRQRAEQATHLFLDGERVSPWLVSIGFDASGREHPIELGLGVAILIFELRQSGVSVTTENVVQFVRDDIKSHREKALRGYLTIVRYVLEPPPRRKSFGWFARMFTSPPSWTPPPTRWKWQTIGAISLSNDDALVIKGTCCEAPVDNHP